MAEQTDSLRVHPALTSQEAECADGVRCKVID
jgi:hypothetical protein